MEVRRRWPAGRLRYWDESRLPMRRTPQRVPRRRGRSTTAGDPPVVAPLRRARMDGLRSIGPRVGDLLARWLERSPPGHMGALRDRDRRRAARDWCAVSHSVGGRRLRRQELDLPSVFLVAARARSLKIFTFVSELAVHDLKRERGGAMAESLPSARRTQHRYRTVFTSVVGVVVECGGVTTKCNAQSALC